MTAPLRPRTTRLRLTTRLHRLVRQGLTIGLRLMAGLSLSTRVRVTIGLRLSTGVRMTTGLRLMTGLGLMTGLLPVAPAAAACALIAPASADLLPAGYSPGGGATGSAVINLQVNGADSGCNWAIGADDSAGARLLSGPGGTIPFDLRVGGSGGPRLRDLPLAGAAELVRGTVPARAFAGASLWVEFPGNLSMAPGNYVGTLRLRLYDLGGGGLASARELETRSLRIALNVLPYVAGRVAAEGQTSAFGTPRTIDFGELASGAQRDLEIQIDTNLNIELSMNADNVSSLVNRTSRGLYAVPYRIDHRQVQRLPAGYRLGLSIVLGEVGSAPPGDYQGAVTFTVTAR